VPTPSVVQRVFRTRPTDDTTPAQPRRPTQLAARPMPPVTRRGEELPVGACLVQCSAPDCTFWHRYNWMLWHKACSAWCGLWHHDHSVKFLPMMLGKLRGS
jgi:hypothetical protein